MVSCKSMVILHGIGFNMHGLARHYSVQGPSMTRPACQATCLVAQLRRSPSLIIILLAALGRSSAYSAAY